MKNSELLAAKNKLLSAGQHRFVEFRGIPGPKNGTWGTQGLRYSAKTDSKF
jgi:hypothetical protein